MNDYRSKVENELFEYVESIYSGRIIQNDRSIIHSELDIFLPDLNLAIEFNGMIFHSDAFLFLTKGINSVDYHSKKMKQCQAKNIKLLYVWEDDWSQNKHSIEEGLNCALSGEVYDDGLFNKLTKSQKFDRRTIYYLAKDNTPKTKKYFPEIPEWNNLDRKESSIFKKLGFSLSNEGNSEPLDKELLADKYDKSILNSLYRKGYIVKENNELIIPGKYMKKLKEHNKYKVPSEYFEPSKIASIREKPDFLIFIVTPFEKLSEISEKMNIDGIENIIVDNYIKCKAKGAMRNYDYSVFSKYSKDIVMTVFSSTETGKKRFCRLFADNELFS